jgi:hypothetical protein
VHLAKDGARNILVFVQCLSSFITTLVWNKHVRAAHYGSRNIILFVQCLSSFIMTLGEAICEPVHLCRLVCEFLNSLCIFFLK